MYDHLGNTRVTYSVEILSANDISYTTESATDYFPYGKTLRSFGKERYLSTYHERDTETDFDYRGARFYDADVARFNSLDPLAADFAAWSPYNYVLGNPVVFVDPDGRNPIKGLKLLGKTAVKSIRKGKLDTSELVEMGMDAKAVVSPSSTLLERGEGLFNLLSPLSTKDLKAAKNFVAGADNAVDATKSVDKVTDAVDKIDDAKDVSKNGGVDYVVSPGGNVASTSQGKMKEGFDNAGFPSTSTKSPGTEHTLPDGNKVRLMDSNGNQGKRAVFQNNNGQPVNQDFKPVNPPRQLSKPEKKAYVRERTHLPQGN